MRLNFQENKPKTVIKYVEKKDYTIIIVIGAIILIGISIIIGLNIYKNSTCSSIESDVLKYAFDYANGNNLLTLNEGDSISVDLEDVYNAGYPTLKNGSTCTGNVKFTLADGRIIKTFDISCGYCSTNKRYSSKWKESSSYVNSNLIDVDVKYNYYNAETFYTKWTRWYPSSDIDTLVNTQYGIRLPLNEKNLPVVPSTAEVLKYDVEYSTYYSYRDKTWKWYQNVNNDYSSEWYSTKPSNYEKKDESTMKYTDWSDWSLNYPEEKDYREIKSGTGYRWFYLDDDNIKHYWNGGAYYPSKPSDDYPSYDDSAVMYQYRDKTWRWYNGESRRYCSDYSTLTPRGCTYKDNLMTSYSKWSNWSTDVPSNQSYRSIDTDIYYRYRAFYRDVNFLVLEDYVSKDEFEELIGESLDNFRSDSTKKISYKYTYLYK